MGGDQAMKYIILVLLLAIIFNLAFRQPSKEQVAHWEEVGCGLQEGEAMPGLTFLGYLLIALALTAIFVFLLP